MEIGLGVIKKNSGFSIEGRRQLGVSTDHDMFPTTILKHMSKKIPYQCNISYLNVSKVLHPLGFKCV